MRNQVLAGLACCALMMSALSGCHRNPRLWTPAPHGPGQPGSKEFTLTWDSQDHNGSPIDPRWSRHPTLPPGDGSTCGVRPDGNACTDHDVVLDLADFPNAFICNAELSSKLHGHVNWTPATAYGKVLWMGLATDRDINLHFFPRDQKGLTGNNEKVGLLDGAEGKYIEVEFSSSETLANFTSTWWKNVFDIAKADGKKVERVDPLLNTQHSGTASNAVIYGLFGLDCEHSCRSEYHPVYAMAIEIDDRPDHNIWAIVVRNWGNEGFCGRLNHELYTPDNRIRLTLPRIGKRPDLVKDGTEFRSTMKRISFPQVEFETMTEQVVLTFEVPEPRGRTNGEMLLHLNWRSGFNDIPPTLRRAPVSPVELNAPPQESEEYIEKLIRDRAQLVGQADSREAAALSADEQTKEVDVPPGGPLPDFVEPKRALRRPSQRLPVDNRKLNADKALWRSICAAYRDGQDLPRYKDQDISKVCASVK